MGRRLQTAVDQGHDDDAGEDVAEDPAGQGDGEHALTQEIEGPHPQIGRGHVFVVPDESSGFDGVVVYHDKGNQRQGGGAVQIRRNGPQFQKAQHAAEAEENDEGSHIGGKPLAQLLAHGVPYHLVNKIHQKLSDELGALRDALHISGGRKGKDQDSDADDPSEDYRFRKVNTSYAEYYSWTYFHYRLLPVVVLIIVDAEIVPFLRLSPVVERVLLFQDEPVDNAVEHEDAEVQGDEPGQASEAADDLESYAEKENCSVKQHPGEVPQHYDAASLHDLRHRTRPGEDQEADHRRRRPRRQSYAEPEIGADDGQGDEFGEYRNAQGTQKNLFFEALQIPHGHSPRTILVDIIHLFAIQSNGFLKIKNREQQTGKDLREPADPVKAPAPAMKATSQNTIKVLTAQF